MYLAAEQLSVKSPLMAATGENGIVAKMAASGSANGGVISAAASVMAA
jgi:hypothetical protein